MDVVFRVDASTQVGTGHLMRCLTLANLLKNSQANVSFLCRELASDLKALVSGQYPIRILAADPLNAGQDAAQSIPLISGGHQPDWLVIDGYDFGFEWESVVRPHVKRILVIDDLANRRHDCDVLLDQNLCSNYLTRYDHLVPSQARKLLGPQYALLRPEFYEAHSRLRVRDGRVRRILIGFGGGDATDETTKALDTMLLLDQPDIKLDVICGPANPHAEAVRDRCTLLPNARFHQNAANMAELMAAADLAIGAGGTSTWERCLLGLPAITLVVAENQRPVCEAMDSAGAVINLGWHTAVTTQDIARAVKQLMNSPERVRRMGDTASGIMGQHGTEGRDELLQIMLRA
jgi:UDP-2,4-diacetamido-2,4,6-trideoxy-beta-L-altropyranose hydrolase